MTWTDIEQNWVALVPSLMARWPGLAENDLLALSGTRAELVAAVARATGDPAPEAERQIEAWMQGPMPADAFAHPTHDDDATRDAARYIPEGEDPLSDDARFGDDDQPDRPIGRRTG